MSIRSVTFNCEVITPMFLGGADQQPELRPPSIRGAMRWWFRAMKAESKIKTLKDLEKAAFGDTDTSSSFAVRLKGDFIIGKQVKQDNNLGWQSGFDNWKRRLLPENEGKNKIDHTGIGYVFYSGLKRQYIPCGSSFDVILSFKKQQHLQDIMNSLWLLIYFGGIGLRSRRGAGSILCKGFPFSENQLLDEQFIFKGSTSGELKTFLESGAKKIVLGATSVGSYSTLKGSTVYVMATTYSSWVEALNEISKVYEKYRFSNRSNIFEGGNFGLPIIHTGNPKTRIIGERIAGKIVERRSSPVIFKVWTNKDKTAYFGGAIHLAGDLLPAGKKMLKQKKTGNYWNDDGSPVGENAAFRNTFFSSLSSVLSFTI